MKIEDLGLKKTEIELSNGEKVTLREPLMRDMKATSHLPNPMEREIALISNLSGIPLEKFDTMKTKDYKLLHTWVTDFL